MMKRDLRFSRRHMLKAIGAGAALLPLLESDRADAACLVSGIKRLYLFCWPNGMLSNVSTWATAGTTPSAWQLASYQTALQPYQADLLLLDGLDYSVIRDMPGSGERTGHACYPAMLTGAYYQTLSTSTAADIAGGPSIDQYIGSTLKGSSTSLGGISYGGLTSLNQVVFAQSTGHLAWKAAGEVVLPQNDPYALFSSLFAGAMTNPTPATAPTTVAMGATAPTAAATAAPVNMNLVKKSILDYVSADLTRFANVVGTADKQNIEAHLTAVRAIETQLQTVAGANTGMASAPGGTVTQAVAPTGAAAAATLPAGFLSPAASGCTPPTAGSGAHLTLTDTKNAAALTQLHIDIGIAAFAADATRVIVMQVGDQGAGELILSWLTSAAGVPYASGGPNPGDANTGDVNGFHAIAHRDVQDKVICDTWFQSVLGYIIGRMKGISDPTGASMLDSSVMVGMNNMRAGLHQTTQVPVVMAGSCGGYFQTGRSLAMTGTAHNGLLVALCNAMGTPVATFGQASYGGELTILKG
jgi:hypothetical protein